jgi:tetratricopeptide (TPR) repeat protein
MDKAALAKSAAASASIAAPAAGAPSASDALAKAQSMWNAGSRLAAMDLLQQTLNQVEAANPSAVTGQSTLARLALELARMNLAEGQVSQALALLTRLEPQLFQVADVWAMRGSAAQRLGQHSEAVKCYRQALLLRPDEPRWMLGQAVSLAVQGQLSAAGEMAEMARVLGGLRPEVANYLRQLGVAVRSD